VLLLPLLAGIFFFVHYYKVVLYGISLPPGREEIGEDTAKRVPKDERTYFIPEILTNELMWTALATLFLVAGALWLWDAPLETHADPVVTPLHVVAPWYLSWSQGWLKLADKTLVVGFIPLLLVAFIVMPYIEVGKSRRYADRRVGLTVAMLFIAFMLVSNWMGSPEFRVQSSPDREVSIELLPEEGPKGLKGIPPQYLTPGIYLPGQVIEGNPQLTRGLAMFEEAMYKQSCTLVGNPMWDACDVTVLESGEKRYSNFFTDDAMPDPFAQLVIEHNQEDLLSMRLLYEVEEPDNPDRMRVSTEWELFRHYDSNYEEECQFLNKSC
jgi:hypothetical protein